MVVCHQCFNLFSACYVSLYGVFFPLRSGCYCRNSGRYVKLGKKGMRGCVCCECTCTHFCVHAMTALFCSESDPVNSSANFSIYPLLCVYKSALSHPIHLFQAFHLFNMPPFPFITVSPFFRLFLNQLAHLHPQHPVKKIFSILLSSMSPSLTSPASCVMSRALFSTLIYLYSTCLM